MGKMVKEIEELKKKLATAENGNKEAATATATGTDAVATEEASDSVQALHEIYKETLKRLNEDHAYTIEAKKRWEDARTAARAKQPLSKQRQALESQKKGIQKVIDSEKKTYEKSEKEFAELQAQSAKHQEKIAEKKTALQEVSNQMV